MAKIEGRAMITATVTIALSESEAGALDALVGYGIEPFLKAFYANMGEVYLKPFEGGMRSLFTSVRSGEGSVANFLKSIKDARKTFNEQLR